MANTQICRFFSAIPHNLGSPGRFRRAGFGPRLHALGRMRQLAVRAGVVDGGWKLLSQNLGELIREKLIASFNSHDGCNLVSSDPAAAKI